MSKKNLLESEELSAIGNLTSWAAPDFLPQNLELNNFVEDEDEKFAEAVDAARIKTESEAARTGSSAPLSALEAEMFDKKVDELLEGIVKARERIEGYNKEIDMQVLESATTTEGNLSSGGTDVTFNVNLRKKRALRNAVKKMFGFAPDKLTYSMYKTALKAKRQLEKEQVEEYMEGNY